MPIHDWTKMLDGDFHDFHQSWIIEIRNALNGGLLPQGYIAMSDQVTAGPIPDVVTLNRKPTRTTGGGTATQQAPPTAKVVSRIEASIYARRANRIVIRRGRGEVVSIIEIVSPGNKHSRTAIRKFVDKVGELFQNGIHMLIVDLFPPTVRDPNGLQQEICDEIEGALQAPLEPGKDRTAGSYLAGIEATAYLECFGVGDPLPNLPLFLSEHEHVETPLESTYMKAWDLFPLKDEMPANG